MTDIKNSKILHFFLTPTLCLAQGIIRPSKAGPCPPLFHIFVLAHKLVCLFLSMCVCTSVPIFPPCGQVTIANQACEPCLKKPREWEGGGDGWASDWVLFFVLITEAEIKTRERMDGLRRGDGKQGLPGWVCAPALTVLHGMTPCRPPFCFCPSFIYIAFHRGQSCLHSESVHHVLMSHLPSLLFFFLLLVPTHCLLSFCKVIMNIGELTGVQDLIVFALGKFAMCVRVHLTCFNWDRNPIFLGFHFFYLHKWDCAWVYMYHRISRDGDSVLYRKATNAGLGGVFSCCLNLTLYELMVLVHLIY